MTEEKKEFDVVADILRAAVLGSKESEIINGCELDRNSLEKYMPVMMILKLIMYGTWESALNVIADNWVKATKIVKGENA